MALGRTITWARAGVNTTITMSGTSQATAAFGPQTYYLRVATGAQPAFIKVGDGTPVADTTSILVGTNVVDYFIVTPGQKAAALQAGTAGSISFTEMQ
jgi:hypothetical protein